MRVLPGGCKLPKTVCTGSATMLPDIGDFKSMTVGIYVKDGKGGLKVGNDGLFASEFVLTVNGKTYSWLNTQWLDEAYGQKRSITYAVGDATPLLTGTGSTATVTVTGTATDGVVARFFGKDGHTTGCTIKGKTVCKIPATNVLYAVQIRNPQNKEAAITSIAVNHDGSDYLWNKDRNPGLAPGSWPLKLHSKGAKHGVNVNDNDSEFFLTSWAPGCWVQHDVAKATFTSKPTVSVKWGAKDNTCRYSEGKCMGGYYSAEICLPWVQACAMGGPASVTGGLGSSDIKKCKVAGKVAKDNDAKLKATIAGYKSALVSGGLPAAIVDTITTCAKAKTNAAGAAANLCTLAATKDIVGPLCPTTCGLPIKAADVYTTACMKKLCDPWKATCCYAASIIGKSSCGCNSRMFTFGGASMQAQVPIVLAQCGVTAPIYGTKSKTVCDAIAAAKTAAPKPPPPPPLPPVKASASSALTVGPAVLLVLGSIAALFQ